MCVELTLLSLFQDHSLCYSDCSFTYTENNRSVTFDLSAMSDVASLIIGPSFTSKGTKYLHMFNISLCGHEVMFAFMGRNDRKWKACCHSNAAHCLFWIATGEESCDLL